MESVEQLLRRNLWMAGRIYARKQYETGRLKHDVHARQFLDRRKRDLVLYAAVGAGQRERPGGVFG